MELPSHYESDLLFYFDGMPLELSLYETLFAQMASRFPQASVKVQKSQISFYAKHLFAAVSLPVRRKRDWPEHCILFTFGLGAQLSHPRIAVAVEPYPHRWTHHVVISQSSQIDQALLSWLDDAYNFSMQK